MAAAEADFVDNQITMREEIRIQSGKISKNNEILPDLQRSCKGRFVKMEE